MPSLATFYTALSTHITSPSLPSIRPVVDALLSIQALGLPSDGVVAELVSDAMSKGRSAVNTLASFARAKLDDEAAAACVEFQCLFGFSDDDDDDFKGSHADYVVGKFRSACKGPLEQLTESRAGHGTALAELLASVSVLLQGLYRWREAVTMGPEGEVRGRLLGVINGVTRELEVRVCESDLRRTRELRMPWRLVSLVAVAF